MSEAIEILKLLRLFKIKLLTNTQRFGLKNNYKEKLLNLVKC